MLYRGALFMNRLREAVCQCPLGLIPHFYSTTKNYALYIGVFQCPHGLKLLLERAHAEMVELRFNAIMGLSCYGKNVQYFKFFMILFYTYLLFIGVY